MRYTNNVNSVHFCRIYFVRQQNNAVYSASITTIPTFETIALNENLMFALNSQFPVNCICLKIDLTKRQTKQQQIRYKCEPSKLYDAVDNRRTWGSQSKRLNTS